MHDVGESIEISNMWLNCKLETSIPISKRNVWWELMFKGNHIEDLIAQEREFEWSDPNRHTCKFAYMVKVVCLD